MTLRVGIAADAARARPASSSSARPSGSASTRCGCPSSGPATPSRRSPTSPAQTSHDPARHRHRAARRPHAGDARDVGAVAAGAVRRPVRARHRHQRPAGDGGLARRPLRPARAPHPRDDRDHPGRHRRPAPRVRRRDLPAAAARRRGPRHPLADAARRTSRSTSPSLGPGQPAPHRRARRRVDRQLVLPGDRRRCSSTRSARAPAAPAARLRDLDLTVSVGVEFTDDVDAAGRRHAEGYAFTFGAMGSADHQLLQRRLRTPGLRRRRPRGAAAVARRRPRGRAPAGAHRHRARHQPRRHRRPHPRSAPPLPRRRHHHAPRPAPRRPGRTTSTANSTTSPGCSTSSTTSTRKPATATLETKTSP